MDDHLVDTRAVIPVVEDQPAAPIRGETVGDLAAACRPVLRPPCDER